MPASLEKIFNRYNPEHDVNSDPRAPRVTWAENQLAECIQELSIRIAVLEEQIKNVQPVQATGQPVQIDLRWWNDV